MKTARRKIAGVVVAAVLGFWGAPACSPGGRNADDAAVEDVSQSQDASGVDAAIMPPDFVGSAWRFTSIYATEPDDPTSTADGAVRDILNELFARYIDLGVLNVMYEILSWTPATGELLVRAGPAMRYPDGRLHMLCGYDAEMPMHVDGLRFRTTRPESLNIHCGTTDAPATCAPDVSAPNAVPIVGLDSQGEFRFDGADGVDVIQGADLSGYITADDAEGICICTQSDPQTGADTCTRSPVADDPLYCKAHCGPTGFAHFGTVLRVIAKVAPVPFQGVPAYRFAGTYGAVRVDDYDAACCTNPNSCP